MKIARFNLNGRPVIAVESGLGFLNYEAILTARQQPIDLPGVEPEVRMISLLKARLLEESELRANIEWAELSGLDFSLNSEGASPLLPLRPGKIVGIARNWAEHAREGGHSLPEKPIYFVKTSNCAIGPGEPVPLPKGVGRVDHEGELAVVIGRRASKIKAESALDYVLGYTIVNDITARELQRRYAERGWPWYLAKSMDGFAPMGPWIITRSEFEPLEGRRVRVLVNGSLRQDGALDDMVWKVPQLIEAISEHITLNPGDVICVGTPPDVGPMTAGDEVAVEIDGLGRLVNPVV